MRRITAVVLAVVVVGLLAGILAASLWPSTAGGLSGVFRRVFGELFGRAAGPEDYVEAVLGEPVGLNPLLYLDSASQQASALIFCGLTRLDNAGEVLPGLATAWQASTGNRVWTFTLRRDATWHDGQPLTARDVSFTYNSLAAADFPGDLRGEWRDIAARYTDDYTAVIELPAADPLFPLRATVPILPRHILSSVPFRDWYGHDFNRKPVGCGPFKLREWRTGQAMVLDGYQGYYLGAPGLAQITLRFMQAISGSQGPAAGLGAAAFTGAGAVNAGLVQPDQAAAVARVGGIKVSRYPSALFAALVPNHRRPAGQLAVRSAISAGLDIQRVVEAAAATFGQATNPSAPTAPLLAAGGPFIPGSSGSLKQPTTPQRDANRARKLLADAGWRDLDADGALERGNEVLRLSMLYPADRPDLAAAAGEIARQLQEYGIVVQATETTLSGYLAAWAPPFAFDLMLMEWVSAPGEDLYELLHSTQQPTRGAGGILRGGANVAGVADAQLDAILAELRATPVTEKATRDSLLEGLNALLTQRAYQVFLWREAGFHAQPEGLDGPQPGPFGTYHNVHEWRWR